MNWLKLLWLFEGYDWSGEQTRFALQLSRRQRKETSMEVIRGFQTKPVYAQRCTGCHVIIGPSAEIKQGYNVVDGEVTGLFHSRQCYADTVKRFEESKKNGGEA